jgi:anti-anti-sigma regulatory factor
MRNQRAPAVVTLPGEIDLYNREQAYDRLHSACASGAPVVIADFTGTRFCDTGSMRRLLAAPHHTASAVQLRFAISPGSPVRRMADLIDVDCRVPVYSSPEEAAAVIA